MLLLLMLFHTITLPAWLVLAWLRVCMCLAAVRAAAALAVLLLLMLLLLLLQLTVSFTLASSLKRSSSENAPFLYKEVDWA